MHLYKIFIINSYLNLKKNKLIYIFFKIINSKKFFFPPKKNRIIILDKVGSNNLCKLLNDINQRDIGVLAVRGEELNLYIFFKLLINFKLNKINYIIEYLKFTKCKFVLTFIDTNITFYKLKNFLPKLKFISFQNGWRDDLFFKKYMHESNLNCDLIICYNLCVKNKYKAFINSKIVTSGSIINNDHRIKYNIENSNKFHFISQIIDDRASQFIVDDKLLNWNSFFLLERNFLEKLSRADVFSKKNLIIISRYREHNKLEYDFYKSILSRSKFTWRYLVFKNLNDLYNYCLSNEFFITIDSTLGYELLTHNKKVFFCSARGSSIDSSRNFAWPLKNLINLENFSNTIDVSFNKLYDYLFKEDSNLELNVFIKSYIMNYDYKNLSLKKDLRKMGL